MYKIHFYNGEGFETILLAKDLNGIDINKNGINPLKIFLDNNNSELVIEDMVKENCDYELENKPLLYYFDSNKFNIILTENMNLTSGYKIKQLVKVALLNDIKVNLKQEVKKDQ